MTIKLPYCNGALKSGEAKIHNTTMKGGAYWLGYLIKTYIKARIGRGDRLFN